MAYLALSAFIWMLSVVAQCHGAQSKHRGLVQSVQAIDLKQGPKGLGFHREMQQ